MKPRVFFLFQKKKKVFHHLALIGTWGGQASVRHLRLWAAHFHPGFRSSPDPAELTSLKKARNTFWLHHSDSHSPSSWEAPSQHFTLLPPSPAPAQRAAPAQTQLLVILNQHDQAALFLSKQNSYFVLFVTPLSPVFLTHWEPYHSRMLRPQRLHTGRSPPSPLQHLQRQTEEI